MDITTYIGAGSVPIILIIVQLFKNFISDGRWYAPVSVILGILINIGVAIVTIPVTPTNLLNAFLIGILAGGSASGIYSGGKEIIAK